MTLHREATLAGGGAVVPLRLARYRLRFTSSCSISSLLVMTRELA